MVICQYFLKGTCRFGSNCRNEHPTGGMGFGKSNSFGTFSQNKTGSTGALARWQDSNNTDADKTIQAIKQEMKVWEASKMWPFSCFSTQKDLPCLTGLLDYSPEEIRLEAYKAKESGTFNEYLQNMTQLNNQFNTRRRELASLTFSTWEQERRKLSNQNSSGLFTSQSTTNNPFSATPVLFSSQSNNSGNPFGSAQSKQTFFGSSSAGQSVFGQQTNSSSVQPVFGQQTSSAFGQSVFGQQNSSSSGRSVFRQQNSSSSGHSVFGQQNSSSSGQSAFGQHTSSSKTPLFGSNPSSSFGNGNSSLFGSASYSNFGPKQQASVFGSVRQSFVSGGQQTSVMAFFGGGVQTVAEGSQQSAFGGQAPAFQGQQATSGGGQLPALQVGQQPAIGGAQMLPAIDDQQSSTGGGVFSKGEPQAGQGLFTQSNIFGHSTQQPNNFFGQSANALGNNGNTTEGLSQEPSVSQATAASGPQNPFLQASIQNKQQECSSVVPDVPSVLKLSEKDLEAYKADRFVIGQIPECPPPLEFC